MLGQYMHGIGYGVYTSFNDGHGFGQFGGIDPFAAIRGPASRYRDVTRRNVTAADEALAGIAAAATAVRDAAGMSAAAVQQAKRIRRTARFGQGRVKKDIQNAFTSINTRLQAYDRAKPSGEAAGTTPPPRRGTTPSPRRGTTPPPRRGTTPSPTGAPDAGAPDAGDTAPEGGGTGKFVVIALVLVTLAAGGYYAYSTGMI